MLGDIIHGDVDTAIAAFGITRDRSLFVDFPGFFVKSKAGAFVRRPQDGDISMKAYLYEFTPNSWSMITVYLTFVTLAMAVIMKNTHRGKLNHMSEIWLEALNITTR
jgi:hypothetical protein